MALIDQAGALSRNALLSGTTSSGANVTVTGIGVTWTINGTLSLSSDANSEARLGITEGATVTVNNGSGIVMGEGDSSYSKITVSGTGSQLQVTGTGSLHMAGGFYSSQTVMVGDGATLSLQGGVSASGGEIQILGPGSTMESGDDIKLEGHITLSGGASLTMSAGKTIYLGSSTSSVYSSLNFGSSYGDTGGTSNAEKIVLGNNSIVTFNHVGTTTLSTNISSTSAGVGGVWQGYSSYTETTILTGSSSYATTYINSGTMVVDGGYLKNESLIVADWLGSKGTFSITNGATVLTGTSYVGSDLGGDVVYNSRNGRVIVSGSGSQWKTDNLYLGGSLNGSGTMTIQDGGHVTSNTLTQIDYNGVANVTGTGSQWTTSGSLQIAGKASIIDGATATSDAALVDGPSAVILVSGPGSAWSVSDSLTIAASGTGTLNITNSGLVEIQAGSGTLSLASNVGSVGTLNLGVNGTAGTISAGEINGGEGEATINFNHTGTVALSSRLTGTLSVNKLGGGTTVLTGSSSYAGTTTINSGTLKAASNTALGNSIVTVGANGTLHVGAGVSLSLTNPVELANENAAYLKDFEIGESLTSAGRIRSNGGTMASTFEVLYGTAMSEISIDVSFSSAPSELALNDAGRLSDVLHIDGTGDTVFVMQLSYTQAAYDAAALAGLYANETELRLGYLEDNQWVWAGDGPFIEGAWNGSMVVGTYGADTSNNVVWAVLDHNSEYAVIPEPSAFALLSLALVGLVLWRRRLAPH